MSRPFGSIDRLPSGRFRVRYVVDGRRYNGERTYRTRGDARRALAIIAADLARGTWVDPSAPKPEAPPTFAVALAEFLDWRAALGKHRPETADGYRSLADNWLGELADRPVAEITRADVNRLVRAMVAAGRQPRTVRNVIRLVSSVLRYCERERQWVTSNVATGVHLPTTPREADAEVMCVLGEDDVHRLADALPGRYSTLVLLTVFGGGLRASEVAGLLVGDFDGESITVARRVRNGRVGATKSAASERTNPLPGWLVPEVAALCAGRDPAEAVFPSLSYSHANFVRRVFRPAVARLGLPGRLRFHDLRHSAASIALAKGVPVVEVARWLGNADAGLTLKVYAHVLPDNRGRVASVFDEPGRRLRAVG